MENDLSKLSNFELAELAENTIKDIHISHKQKHLIKINKNLFELIKSKTSFLEKFIIDDNNKHKNHIGILERLYCLKHNLTDRPKCLHCKKNYVSSFKTNVNEYSLFCSSLCGRQSDYTKQKRLNYFNEYYGCDNPFQNETIKDKIKLVNLERYGVEYPQQNNDIRKKSEETCIQKFGYKSAIQNKDIHNQIKQTNLEKYGCECSLQNEEVIAKSIKTNLEKYGATCVLASNKYIKYTKKCRAKQYYKKLQLDTYSQPLFSETDLIQNYLEANCTNDRKPLKFKCKKCGNIFEETLNDNFQTNRQHAKCPICYPLEKPYSNQEKELVEYIKSIYTGEIIENSRLIINPYELDAYLPEIKLAIEYNGEYWHYGNGFRNKPKNYHQMKYDMCKLKGIKLIFIRERNWIKKCTEVKEFIKNIIKSK